MKLKVLLLDLKTYYPSPAYQLGLMVEYARLEPEVRESVEFTISEHPRREPGRDIARTVLESGADLVAASNYAWTYKRLHEMLDVTDAAGARAPRILLGGPNSSGEFGAAMMRRHPSISAMVEGEGEPAFRDICSALVDSPRRDPFATARNCVVRGEDGAIVRPSVGHRIRLLDEVPSPYLSGFLPAQPSPIFYETNRGCPYRCAFCYWGNGNAKIYRMSAERIREEMEFFARSRVASFWIADANFGIFKEDAEIAATMAEINARHGRPFKHVGVNWAKQSSDRVLEIAEIFRDGGMACTTTMALQSVTPEAEIASKRYSMAPSKFASLIRRANESGLDTYTDVIWGLPGESFDEFLDGLGSIVATGVPAILMHQLYLLPGTEFYEQRRDLGLRLLSECGGTSVAEAERSEFADYIVVGHPKMSPADLVRGTRVLGISHVLHNHDLGRVLTFFLARFGVTHRQVVELFDRVLLGEIAGFDSFAEPGGLLADLRREIVGFAENVGLDEYAFYFRLSQAVWFGRDERGRRRSRADEAHAFLRRFVAALCDEHGIAASDDRRLLADVATYNFLVSPKPAWRPAPEYALEWDIHRIWRDMQREIHAAAERVAEVGDGSVGGEHAGVARRRERPASEWPDLVREVASGLRALLTPEYLAARRTRPRYRVVNPWRIAPVLETADWLLSSRSKHCTVEPID
jgi:radical SAM superfamily enzyme YgiQ (UPF0313 family)